MILPRRSRSISTIRSSLAGAALVGAVVACASSASAQDAVGLFKQARALSDQGKWAEACPLFSEAHRLEPKALGILINLAECDKHIGKTASAWSAYQEAEFLAKKDQDHTREQFAHDEAAALEPRLSKLRINAKDTPGLIIRRDDQEVGKGVWGTPFPVDPGAHKIEATAPGYSVWTTTLTIGAERDLQVIEIPSLTRAAGSSGPDGGSGGGNPGLRPAAFVVGGLGVAGIVVGGIFGGLASGAASTVKSACKNNQCSTPAAQSDLSSANSKALIATVGVGAGAGLLATGVILFIVGRPAGKRDEAPRAAQILPSFGVSPSGGTLSAVGSF